MVRVYKKINLQSSTELKLIGTFIFSENRMLEVLQWPKVLTAVNNN